MDDMNKEAQQVRENGTIYKKVSIVKKKENSNYKNNCKLKFVLLCF